MQEIGLAKQASIVCGEQCVDWQIFSEVATAMYYSGLEERTLRERTGKIGERWLPIIHMSDMKTSTSFSSLLFFGTMKQCTEPVDRIYGILGLAAEDVRKEVKVQYKKVETEGCHGVYVEAARCALKKDDDLFLLSITSSLPLDESLPSWCPSFRGAQERTHLFMKHFHTGICKALNDEGEEVSVYRGCQYPPSRQFKELRISTVTDIIHISGIQVDTITAIIETHSWPWIYDPGQFYGPEGESVKRLAWLSSTLQKAQQIYQTGMEIPDRYIRTLIGDDFMADDRSFTLSGDSNIDSRREAYHLCMDILYWQARDGSNAEFPCPDEVYTTTDAFLSNMAALWRNRVFIVTEGGRIGAAAPGVEAGDTICVLFGGKSAYVARRKSDAGTWRFMGEAYVDGLMSGEVFDMLRKGEVKQEMIAFD
jgi:hypothetical protein